MIHPLRCLSVAFVVAALGGASSANESVTITVEAGAQHTFGGFGSSADRGHGAAVAQRLYHPDEADMRIIRLWAHTGGDALSLASRYAGYVNEIKKVQPDVIVLLAPCQQTNTHVGDVNGFAAYYCQGIKTARDQGLHIHMTGACNEMENYGRIHADQIAPLLRAYRSNLDSRGLQDVKIIAPESATVDSTMYQFIDNIMADQQAYDALDGWGYHSYNCSITEILREKVFDTAKPIWQTESSTDGSATIEGGANSGQIGASNGVRILADLNMGTTHWFYFFGAGDGADGTALIYNDGRPKLQYYYLLQVAKTIEVGARFRYCLSQEPLPRYEMTWEYGQKPAIVCAAAVNPDGSWGIGICNGTGIQRNISIASFYPAATYDVTVYAEELESAGAIDFQVQRTNKSGQLQDEGTVTMEEGRVSLTLQSLDLVCLRSSKPVGTAAPQAQPARDQKTRVEKHADMLRVHLPQQAPYALRLFDMQGKIVFSHEGIAGRVDVPFGVLPAGAYVLNLSTGGRYLRRMLSLGGAESPPLR